MVHNTHPFESFIQYSYQKLKGWTATIVLAHRNGRVCLDRTFNHAINISAE